MMIHHGGLVSVSDFELCLDAGGTSDGENPHFDNFNLRFACFRTIYLILTPSTFVLPVFAPFESQVEAI